MPVLCITCAAGGFAGALYLYLALTGSRITRPKDLLRARLATHYVRALHRNASEAERCVAPVLDEAGVRSTCEPASVHGKPTTCMPASVLLSKA